MNLTQASQLKALLRRHGFSFSKSLGQNFLIDPGVLDRIASVAAPAAGCVLEIGPGAGVLTRELARRAERVAAVEIDGALLPVLAETLADCGNVTLIHQDILETDLARLAQEVFLGRPFSVAANLPYYITTPIVMRLLESDLPVTDLTLMVQKEVAERMTAQAGTKAYGALSVAVQYYTRPSLVCRAEPHCFLPQPKVASAVIHLETRPTPAAEVSDPARFFQLVRAAFGQRRKTLVNALSNAPGLGLDKARIGAALAAMGFPPDIRGERLTVADFAALEKQLETKE